MAGCFPILQVVRDPMCLLEFWRHLQPPSAPRSLSLRHSLDNVWVQGGGLGVEEGAEGPRPPLEDVFLAPEQHNMIVLCELLFPCLSPGEAHRSREVFVQPSFFALRMNRFEIRHVVFKVGMNALLDCCSHSLARFF